MHRVLGLRLLCRDGNICKFSSDEGNAIKGPVSKVAKIDSVEEKKYITINLICLEITNVEKWKKLGST